MAEGGGHGAESGEHWVKKGMEKNSSNASRAKQSPLLCHPEHSEGSILLINLVSSLRSEGQEI